MNCLEHSGLEALGADHLNHLELEGVELQELLETETLGHLEHLGTGVKEVDCLVRLEVGALVYLVYLELETEG